MIGLQSTVESEEGEVGASVGVIPGEPRGFFDSIQMTQSSQDLPR